MKSILDPSFQYTASFNTDIQKTFARILRDRQKDVDGTAPAAPAAFVRFSTLAAKTATGR
jgi:hypothetical protein